MVDINAHLTRKSFEDWGRSCRVRKVAAEYERLVADAEKHKHTPQEEMKLRGYRDYVDFSSQCPLFPLTCHNFELKEVGSGFVMYFNFLLFCILLLVALTLVQISPLQNYAEADGLTDWVWASSAFSDSDEEACSCVGTNNGVLGMNPSSTHANYGETCSIWDYSDCSLGLLPILANDTTGSLGKWCCRRWCWASNQCPVTRDRHEPSRSNRQGVPGTAAEDLVRSYSGCDQDEDYVDSMCNAGDLAHDIPFSSHVFEDASTISEVWLTPGSLGPEQGNDNMILTSYVIATFVVGIFVVYMSQYTLRIDSYVEQDSTNPSDWAIMVSKLPTHVTDESEIAEWFRKHSAGGDDGNAEIVKVVICYDPKEWRAKKKELSKLSKQVVKLKKKGNTEEVKAKEKEIHDIKRQFRSAGPNASTLHGTGKAVVVFRFQSDLRVCLRAWGRKRRCFTCCQKRMPDFTVGGVSKQIEITQAEAASNINWEDLGISLSESLKLGFGLNMFMLLLLGASLGIVALLTVLGNDLRDKSFNEKTGQYELKGSSILSFLPAVAVSSINVVVVSVSRYLGEREAHDTVSQQTASQMIKMTTAIIFNTALVLLICNLEPRDWYVRGGLVEDMYYMIAITAVCQAPAMVMSDYTLIFKIWNRWKLRKGKLNELNESLGEGRQAISASKPPPYNSIKAYREVKKLEKMFEPCEMDICRHYTNALSIVCCCIVYMPLIPLSPIIGLFGLTLQYCNDKVMLLRYYRRPSVVQSIALAQWSLGYLKTVSLIGLPAAIHIFLSPSYAHASDVRTAALQSAIISVLFILTPGKALRYVSLAAVLPCCQRRKREIAEDRQDYYEAQHQWPAEMKYHKSHFLYRDLPNSKNPENFEIGKNVTLKSADLSGCKHKLTRGRSAFVLGGKCVRADRSDVVGVMLECDSDASGDEIDTPGTIYGLPSKGSEADRFTVTPVLVDEASKRHYTEAESLLPEAGAVILMDDTHPRTDSRRKEHSHSSYSLPTASGVVLVDDAHQGRGGHKRSKWEIEQNGDFSRFNKDCEGYIEKKYQDYMTNSGEARVKVRTEGKEVSVDFQRMTAYSKGHGVQNIRRLG